MSKLKTFLYCESIHNEVNGNAQKPSLIGPLVFLNPLFIPGMFSFSIFMMIENSEMESKHKFRVVFKSLISDEVIIDSGYQELPERINEANIPEQARGYMINMDFRNVVLRQEGEYTTEIFFDGTKLGDYPIYAKVVEANV